MLSFLALRGTELPVVLVGTVFFFVYLMSRAGAREREQKRRLELVEKALESGAIDERTKRELVEAVTAKPPGLAHPLFLIGWVGLFAGIGMIVLATTNQPYLWEPAILTAAVSFGVLSVPIASRELQSRRHA